MIVEDSNLLLRYPPPPGGRRCHVAADHAHNTVEALVVAHKKGSGEQNKGTQFTVNKRVVPSDVLGMSTGPIPTFIQFMDDLQYPPGAPNGGTKVLFPHGSSISLWAGG